VTADTIEFGRDGIVSDDRELARRAQQGDAEAHAELLRRHRRMVVSVVYAVLGCRDEAEDTAQEAFVNAHRGIKGYRLRYPYVAWLRRIAVNAAISQLRRRRRTRRADEIGAAANPGPAAHPIEHVAAAERGASVRRAVEGLPLKQRLAVTLFHLEDMSLADAAEAMGCSVGAVKSHLHRARENLALRLSPHLKEAEL